jgi:hypothetical protein
VGKTVLERSLGTDSLAVASAKHWAVIAELRKHIAEAEARGKAGPLIDPITTGAVEWRETHTILEDVARVTDDPADRAHPDEIDDYFMRKVVPEVERNHGAAKAREFLRIARGERTPLGLHFDRFLNENRHLARRTLMDHRRAIERLAEFATAAGWLCTVETFDRRAAVQYASHLESTGTHPVTANKHLSSLSAFWKWMLRKVNRTDFLGGWLA